MPGGQKPLLLYGSLPSVFKAAPIQHLTHPSHVMMVQIAYDSDHWNQIKGVSNGNSKIDIKGPKPLLLCRYWRTVIKATPIQPVTYPSHFMMVKIAYDSDHWYQIKGVSNGNSILDTTS